MLFLPDGAGVTLDGPRWLRLAKGALDLGDPIAQIPLAAGL